MDLNELYRTNYNSYLKFYKGRCGSQEDAEDVIQEAFTRALKYWSSYDPERQKLDIWFSRVLSNAYKDWRTDSRNGGLVRYDLEDDVSYEDGGMHRENIEPLINSYNERYREVLKLYFISGYKGKEIALITEYSHSNVRKIIHDFMKSLE